jgi:thiamine biosynthesis protein ThiS
MQIQFNGTALSLDTAATLGTLIASQCGSHRHLAVAINEQIIPQSRWDTTPVQDGDAVEVVQAVGGG